MESDEEDVVRIAIQGLFARFGEVVLGLVVARGDKVWLVRACAVTPEPEEPKEHVLKMQSKQEEAKVFVSLELKVMFITQRV